MAKDAVIVTVAAASVEAVVDVAAAEAGPGTAGGRGAGNFVILLVYYLVKSYHYAHQDGLVTALAILGSCGNSFLCFLDTWLRFHL